MEQTPSPPLSDCGQVYYNRLRLSHRGVDRLSFTARIERPPFHRGGSASKKDGLAAPPSFSQSRMEGLGTEAFDIAQYASQSANQVPWRRSSRPLRRPAKSTTIISRLNPSHYGEAGAAHTSSAEAHLPPG